MSASVMTFTLTPWDSIARGSLKAYVAKMQSTFPAMIVDTSALPIGTTSSWEGLVPAACASSDRYGRE